MKKIRVLFIATDPSAGMIPFVSTILNVLNADTRFIVKALCVNAKGKSFKESINCDLDIVYFEYPKTAIKKLFYKIYPYAIINKINKILKEESFDIVHFLVGEFAFAYFIKQFKDKNIICNTIHDLHSHEREKLSFKEYLIDLIIKHGDKIFISNTPNLTTSSKTQYEELKKLFPEKNIKFTHFPSLVTDEIKKGKEQVPELKDVSDYILFFGRVDKYKGVDLLIQAYKQSSKLKNTKLVIAGKGIEYEKNNNIIRINRFISDNEVAWLFKKSKFVVYPYISATMSGVLSLAYFFNKRVLLSDVPFFLENKTECCTFFKNKDIIDLQNKLELLYFIDDQNDNKQCYDSIYSNKVLADDYYNFYKSIINE